MRNKHLAQSISRQVISSSPDLILEVGPGTGVFTNLFIQSGVGVVAIEKDDELSRILSMLGPDRLTIYNEDILQFDLKQLEPRLSKYQNIVVFGALPYNISKQIIARLLPIRLFTAFYFIIQREVADKYIRREKGNRLNTYSSLFATTKIMMSIAPQNFFPVPKVQSALIRFTPHEEPTIRVEDASDFEAFVGKLFANPRKNLKNNSLLKAYPIPVSYHRLRAEELDIGQIIEIFELVHSS